MKLRKSTPAVLLCVLCIALPARADEAPAVAKIPGKTRTVEELASLVKKSVVVISYTDRTGRQAGLGAGFVISDGGTGGGLIATNLHVIGDAREISVRTADGRRHKVTSIHATDRPMDLAVIRVATKNLPPLPLGDSEMLKQGQEVVAVGNPQGLEFSVVSGIVSGRREIDGKPLIQLAIPIEPGNSGGPLLDMQGRVHGILSLKSLLTRNLGFAVGVNALKPLLEKPNPVPMSRWITIGTLDPRKWETLFGAKWRQRAGRIVVEGFGSGFGGRSLCLSRREIEQRPVEIGVWTRLEQADGAAGLVFHSDGNNRHYGFYPSSGRMRLSRFEGPDVFAWHVLQEVETPHYRPGEWNFLKVRLEKDRIRCFVNDEPVIESSVGSTDRVFTGGRIGLAKFRHTEAEFKGFRVGESLESIRPSPETVKSITDLVAGISPREPPDPELIEALLPHGQKTESVLRNRAKHLEQQAEKLRELAGAVHRRQVQNELVKLFAENENNENVDLLRGALLVARLDNSELDVEAYIDEVDRLAAEIEADLPEDAGETTKLQALDRYLFEELGFHGSRTDYYNNSNSYLNEVIDDREGLPITMSVLYMELARRLGVPVTGVGLPGHFVVRYEPEQGEGQLINVYDRGKRLTREEAAELVEETSGLTLTDEYLQPQSKREITVRMLRNLMGTALENRDIDGMLRYTEAIVALEPESGQDRWYRAVLRHQTKRYRAAKADVDWLLEHQPADVDLTQVQGLRLRLEDDLAGDGNR